MIRQILRWIRYTYFSAGYAMAYTISTTNSWNTVLSNFEAERAARARKDDLTLLIGTSASAITVSNESPSGFRSPAGYLYAIAQLTQQKGVITVYIDVYTGEHGSAFLPLWKGVIFIISCFLITVNLISAIHGTLHFKDLPLTLLVLLFFNGMCWVLTSLFTLAARALLNGILEIVDANIF